MKARPIRIDQLTAALFNHLAENTRILNKLTADAGQVRTMDDCQKLFDQTGRQVDARDTANQGSTYNEYYGYTVEYWLHSGQIGVRLTDGQPGGRAVKFGPLDKPLAEKPGIPYDELMAELQN